MSATLAKYQSALHPTALAGPYGRAWATSLGGAKDTEVARAKLATKARFLNADTPADALPRIGADRALERGTIETDAEYRARLVSAFDLWGWAGTPYGYAKALALTSAEIAGARVVAQYQWTAPDGLTALWSRFWVIVWTGALAVGRFTVGPWAEVGGTASPFALLVVGSFTVGDGSTVGSDMTVAQLGEIRRTLAKWKNARDRVPGLMLVDGGDIIGTPGLLVGGFVVGGSAITYTLDLVVGSFTVGATPETDPTGPWFPFLGRSNLV